MGRLLAAGYDAFFVDVKAGDYAESFSQRIKAMKELAETLKTAGVGALVYPFAGGISKATDQQLQQDADRVRPSFEIGQHDNPRFGAEDERLGGPQ